LAAFEAIGRDGATALIKVDGQRSDESIFTVVVSGGPLGDVFFRKDGADLEALLREAVMFYRAHVWSVGEGVRSSAREESVTADITIVVAGARSGGPDSAALHASYRVDALRAALSRRLGCDVPVIHRTLVEDPPEGVLLFFCGSLTDAMADVPAAVAARVIWMTAGRTDIREGLARYGLLGAVEFFTYFRWAKDHSKGGPGGLYAKADVASALAGALTANARVPGYVLLGDPRYKDLLSLIRAYAAVATGHLPPSPDAIPPPPPEFPIGRVLDMGQDDAYRIIRAVSGTPDRGLYEAQHAKSESVRAYVSLGPRQTVPWDQKQSELALPEEGFSPLLGIVRIEHQGTAFDALIEPTPPGAPLPEFLPDGGACAGQAARLLLPVLGWVAAAHRQGRVVVGLRPELVFAAFEIVPDDREWLPRWHTFRPRATGVVPRCERFLVTADRPCYGFGPPFETLYQAPEVLNLRPPTPAADVFSLAAILAWLISGSYPFPGTTMTERLGALMTGSWIVDAVPDALAPLLSRALAPDPEARPELAVMQARLKELI
jgi:hypothetical protein